MKKHLRNIFLLSVSLITAFVLTGCSSSDSSSAPTERKNTVEKKSKDNSSDTEGLIWSRSESGFTALSEAPECPEQPMLKSPVDVNKATSILYPGQTRGGNYKPHGGFRFTGTTNIDVKAPIDGYVFRGSSYIESGEVQYLFDVMNNCGVMFRLDHLLVLTPEFQAIADKWPAPQPNNSATQNVDPPVYIKAGTAIAAGVGFSKSGNSFIDFGVYDYRSTNEASKNAEFQKLNGNFKELSYHGVCWFDWLPAADATKVKSLPAGDGASGTKSDYCTT